MADERYLGAMGVPEDFDVFWDARMAEADAVPLEWEIRPSEIPASPACEFLDLWFTGMGGARLYAKYLRPRTAGSHPLVLQFHGYPGASRSWYEQASFAGIGCALIALDNPGQGGKSQDVGGFMGTTVSGHLIAGLDGPLEDMYYVRLYQDVRILCRIVAELGGIDLTRVFVNGASQGAGIGIACAALNPELVSRAAFLYPFLSDYRRVYELGADEVAYEGLRYYARWFDPDGEREDEWFSKLAYVDSVSFAHRLCCPVLFGTGLADEVCPPITQDAVFNNLSCPVERLFFEGKGHEEIQDFDDLVADFLGCPGAERRELTLAAPDGQELRCLYMAPEGAGPHPLVLLFHDLGRPARGWHHITRYLAAGYAVLQLENREGASAESFGVSADDALAAYELARGLEEVDEARIVAFGEGFGGALALHVAAHAQLMRASALAPYPAAPLMDEAATIACPVLLGICRMDAVADVAALDELAGRIGQLTLKNYPKYEHERVNAFEDALLSFTHID